ncbi:hypothetical protein [Paenibacillus puerhi]|uniref:hypothetical protein n=1 Tax=Paenibacillus puerhi TaxID=2692622 RepID=UPI001F15C5DA|nr:hypothetical protein [Paenibacillus puerhi]
MRLLEPQALSDQTALRLGSGGRYDVIFTMPDHPVLFKLGDFNNENSPGIIFYTESPPEKPVFQAESAVFDPSDYGKPVVNDLTSANNFDRRRGLPIR